MPLNGSDVASRVPGTTAAPNTTIESAKYNSEMDDIYSILNTVRSIAKGFTGATSASGVRTNIGLGTSDTPDFNGLVLSNATAGVIKQAGTDRQIQVLGGTTAANGSGLFVFGSTHATTANDYIFTAGGNTRQQWDNSAGNHDWYNGANSLVMRLGAASLVMTGTIAATGTVSSDVSITSGGTGTFVGAVSMAGLTATTGSFSGAVSMAGALSANSLGITTSVTTGSISSGTGTFSGAVSMAGLTATTGTFSGLVDAANYTTAGGGFHTAGKTASNPATVGASIISSGQVNGTVNADTCQILNRIGAEGTIVQFRGDNVTEGTISEAGGTVTYNAFLGSHWSQLRDGSKPDILRGTVCETIDELCEWPKESNDRLPKFKVSDAPGSTSVYGVFLGWDNDDERTNDAYIASIGAGWVRIAPGAVVQKGDLLESDGAGCARAQSDGVFRASTIAKVTSGTVIETYPDGSYLVPCTLHAG